MIDFACRQFNLDDIIKCGLGLTKAEFKVFCFFVDNDGKEFTSGEIEKRTGLDLTTAQKAVKKLSGKKIITRSQKNLDNGGYIFRYKCSSKKDIRETLKAIIRKWSGVVEEKIDTW